MSVIAKIKIDRKHSIDLLHGKPVTVKVPTGCEMVRIYLDSPELTNAFDGIAQCIDTFFNGRKA